MHFDGDVPLRLRVGPKAAVELSFGDGRAEELTEVVLTATGLAGRTRAFVRTRAEFHGVPELEFQLEREGNRLRGVCTATVPLYFGLPFWVELEKVK